MILRDRNGRLFFVPICPQRESNLDTALKLVQLATGILGLAALL